MSVEAVDAVLRGVFDVDPSAKLVLLVIAEHARHGNGGVAWPSIATIAREACISERPAQAHIRDVVAAGWLAIEQRSRGGRGRTNVYRLNLPRMIAVAGAVKATKTSRNPAAGDGVKTNETPPPAAPLGRDETPLSATRNPAAGNRNPAVHGAKTPLPAAPEPVLNRNLIHTGVEPARARERWRDPAANVNPGVEELNNEPEEPTVLQTDEQRRREEQAKAWVQACVEAAAAGRPFPPKPTTTGPNEFERSRQRYERRQAAKARRAERNP